MKRGFVLHHNGPPASCVGKPHTRCVAFWNAVKAYHQQKWPKSNDIAYSFGVCPHGVQFTGRGWDKNQFANGSDDVGVDDGKDSEWYSVLVFLGGVEQPTDAMVDGVVALIDEGRATGRCARRVLPHNAFKRKACPGPEFTAYARAWDNQPLPTTQLPEDDMTPAEANEVLVTAITTPGHPFRKELAAIIDSRLVSMKIAQKADTGFDAAEVKAFAVAVRGEFADGEAPDDAAIEAAVRRVFADAGME